MRIGLVLPEAPQYSETFFNLKIKGLKESGFDVVLFTGKKNKKKSDLEIRSAYLVKKRNIFSQVLMYVYVILKAFLLSPKRSLKLFRLESEDGKSFNESLKSVYINAHIISEEIDILHFGFATMALRRENTAKSMDALMSVSFRGYDINIYPLKNPGCYKKVWENTDKVHTISEYLRSKAIRNGLSENTPFKKITPAIDPDKLPQTEIRKDISSPRILTVGRLNWIKNYETAISAMKMLADEGVNFEYTIVGVGPEIERLKFAVYQYDLGDKIIFAGKKSHEEVKELMNSADIYLQPSFEEGFCVSVLEAQAAGLMCIVSDAEGLKENVIDGETGWVVPKRDFRTFKKKITEVTEMSYENRKKISDNARLRVINEFKAEDQKKYFKEFFETMTKKA
ncbi:MAG: glycosyltransferase family 4 protein [Ignavibacteria bacterium]|nr:glycosyltransferase family 4 protein [Ignavibacteria bacterium]